MNVTRAFLPYMRAQKSDVIDNFGSIASWGGGLAFGLYAATKWTISGLSEPLRSGLEPFGIKAVVIKPG